MHASRTSDLVRILTLVQAFRVVGAVFLVELQRGNLPGAFAIPAGVGDVLVGITAPIVAVSLGKPSILRWAVALAWNALGIVDLVYAAAVGLLAGATYILTSYLVVIPLILVPAAIILHVANIVLLARRLGNASPRM